MYRSPCVSTSPNDKSDERKNLGPDRDQLVTVNTPRQFLTLVVEPNFRDYMEHLDDIRRAFNAAISCQSLRDWMVKHYAGTPMVGGCHDIGNYQSYLLTQNPMFGEVADIANAAKHFTIDQGPSSGRDVTLVGWTYLRVGDPVGITLRPLRVHTRSNELVLFAEVLKPVIEYWRTLLPPGLPPQA